MPLTRHFYAIDEVQAAIIYTGSRGIPKETAFWCHELVISGHASETISALFESWLWHRGPFHLYWLIEATKRLGGSEISEEDILSMAQQLSTCSIKDRSLWTLFTVSASDPESLFDRVTPRSPPVPFPTDDPLEQYFIRAIHQHKSGAAWWAALHLSNERCWSLMEWYRDYVIATESALKDVFDAIRGYEQLLGYQAEAYDNAMRALALLSLCLTAEQRRLSLSAIPSSMTFSSEWDCVIGRKAGRVYPIPYYGIYGVTVRGRMRQTDTTLSGLFDIKRAVRGCAVWDEIIEMDSSDSSDSSFYHTYFPDDIPDEWTAKEKEMSHGCGILQRTEQVTLWGYTKRYLTSRSRLLWNKSTHMDLLDSIELSDSPFLTLLSIPVKLKSINEAQLYPVHKRKVIQG